MNSHTSYEHVVRVLDMYAETVALIEQISSEGYRNDLVVQGKSIPNSDLRINSSILNILNYTNQNFTKPPAMGELKNALNCDILVEEISSILANKEFVQKLWALPPELAEPCIVTAILRDFLGLRKQYLNPTSEAFRRFAMVHFELILTPGWGLGWTEKYPIIRKECVERYEILN